ncbi:MAG: hypothetical protein RLZZ597_3716, partial [Cyanobacteriota bacterium]|jgi:hypothetical protein
LIRYYEQFPPEECQWVINFLEVFRVTFAIYTENIEYNLVQVNTELTAAGEDPADPLDNLSNFRIFSQNLRRSSDDYRV